MLFHKFNQIAIQRLSSSTQHILTVSRKMVKCNRTNPITVCAYNQSERKIAKCRRVEQNKEGNKDLNMFL